MILKSYEISKINLSITQFILFYGMNEGAKFEEISKLLSTKQKKNILNYEEKQVLENSESFFNNLLSKSLFENEKVIIINRVSDKILKIIEELLTKNIVDILIIINAGNLEKKSKLRALFEKNNKMVCIPFYPDTSEILSRISINFFKEKGIAVSQSNINLIINKCNGDRGVLKNELEKLEFFSKNTKKITTENLLKLINLAENYSISELTDNCLAKNYKKTIHILNENNFNQEDCIIITRTLLSKLKRILVLSKEYKKNNNINLTISNAKPPIFWKDKEIIKSQIIKRNPDQINKLIININDIELQIKKNYINPIHIISNFILEQSS